CLAHLGVVLYDQDGGRRPLRFHPALSAHQADSSRAGFLSVQQGTLRTVHRQLCGFRPGHAILASTRHPAHLLPVDWGEIGTNTSEKYGAYRGGIQATSRESASFGGAYH